MPIVISTLEEKVESRGAEISFGVNLLSIIFRYALNSTKHFLPGLAVILSGTEQKNIALPHKK